MTVTDVVVRRSSLTAPSDLEQELRDSAVVVLAAGQRPTHHVIVDAVPLSAAGQVEERALRQQDEGLAAVGAGA